MASESSRKQRSQSMLIAQITDMHIRPEGVLAYGHVNTATYLVRAASI